MTYRIVWSPEAREHFRHLTARQRATALERMGEQLEHDPDLPTRNRKMMRSNELAVWELRIGDVRVYYDVQGGPGGPEPTVQVRAIATKVGNRVYLGGERHDI